MIFSTCFEIRKFHFIIRIRYSQQILDDKWMKLVFSVFLHWTRYDSDTCPQRSVSNVKKTLDTSYIHNKYNVTIFKFSYHFLLGGNKILNYVKETKFES